MSRFGHPGTQAIRGSETVARSVPPGFARGRTELNLQQVSRVRVMLGTLLVTIVLSRHVALRRTQASDGTSQSVKEFTRPITGPLRLRCCQHYLATSPLTLTSTSASIMVHWKIGSSPQLRHYLRLLKGA